MNNGLVYSQYKNDDEYYTYYGDVKYFFENIELDGNTLIWFAFDTENSNFVKYVSKETSYNWIATHIQDNCVNMCLNGNYYSFYSELDKNDFYEISPSQLLKWVNINENKFTKKDIVVISNPPFKNKSRLIERLVELKLSFALLLPVQIFNGGQTVRVLESVKDYTSIFYYTNRVRYFKYDSNGSPFRTDPPFHSIWLLYKFPNLENKHYILIGYKHTKDNKLKFFE